MKKKITNCRVLDALHTYENLEVLIEGDRVIQVAEKIEDTDAETIDLGGMTLMPAFCDAHVHTKPMPGPCEAEDEILAAYAKNGVSAVKDLGILDHFELEPYMDWIQTTGGPGSVRIATAGRYIDVKDGYGAGPFPDQVWGIVINTPEEAADMVTYEFMAGVNGIKIGLNDGCMVPIKGKLSAEYVKAITDRASKHGIWTTAHVFSADDLRMLVENGIGEAAHTPHDRLIDDDVIAKMVEKGIRMTTTIGTASENDPLPEHVPPVFDDPQSFIKSRAEHRLMVLKNVEKFYKAGGQVAVGTDRMGMKDPEKEATIPVDELRQLRNIVGMTLQEVITAGTITSFRACGFADEGMVRVGNKASLIAFEGELNDNFDQLLDLKFVMNQGVILKG